ncbi:TetR family transcriptional regulator [Burkholderia stabilis]|uniref:TetR/AcrR family transcriptional regulator n=1 Tax=Burkholderia stabilis TaxID=95485 RepID=UPI000851AFCE|nr:TetR/AcrR family transcriptional regulator [Burkholderia stabilis]AOR72814.1 TetR family transcriptional regulator [Burkholderia stabilis]HDR9492322.1 TetR/AcrR family transcriptional regulator [Burkholderia stabilis]HDR9496470.1 TetR/AcrR family transcriptional regulator [Burkholderia stabilis]HDR9522864.1 TetR/AcrR family transcriptional regulator [Burkholderia stabilis]HDR9528355.1 TetR/AcrR family transcriptional regulator [Burkholderia stabilis]
MTEPKAHHGGRRRRPTRAASSGSDLDGLRAQGLRTRNTIVRVARELLLKGGPLTFSQRAVAAGAGISVSNLQYYFPTRLAVLRAVIEPVIDAYLVELKRVLDSDASPDDVLERVLARSLSDAKDAQYGALFRHFLSFAAIDPECLKLFDGWYDTLTREIAALLRTVNPAFDAADGLHVATLLIATADGLTMQSGSARFTQRLDAMFMETAHCLIYGKRP